MRQIWVAARTHDGCCITLIQNKYSILIYQINDLPRLTIPEMPSWQYPFPAYLYPPWQIQDNTIKCRKSSCKLFGILKDGLHFFFSFFFYKDTLRFSKNVKRERHERKDPQYTYQNSNVLAHVANFAEPDQTSLGAILAEEHAQCI